MPEATPEATHEITELTPNYSVEGDGVVLDVYFGSLQQGRVGLLGLMGDDITSATANLGVRWNSLFRPIKASRTARELLTERPVPRMSSIPKRRSRLGQGMPSNFMAVQYRNGGPRAERVTRGVAIATASVFNPTGKIKSKLITING